MAVSTLSTGLSRRSILQGGALVPCLGLLPLLPVPEALPASASLPSVPEADSELFRRIAVAERLRSEHARARRLRDRLRAARAARGGFRPRPLPAGDPALWRHWWDSFERYADAVRAAVAVPADRVAGVHAKLALAVIAARRGGARVYMYEDREWLEIALADLRRIAERDAATGRSVPGDPARHGRLST